MKRNYTYLCALCLICALCAISCSHIDENERLIYVQPAAIGRAVLIEDFTGQRCVNCPTATQTIASLQETYGEENVVAVAIHSGPFGHSARGVAYPMTTEIGEAFYQHWGFDQQPIGIVNRQQPSDYSDWGTQVYSQLQQTARVKLEATATYSGQNIDIEVTSTAQEGALDGKMQIWLTEDGITAFQYQPDGSNDREYVHNHVFRDAVNGMWGTDFHIDEAEIKSETFLYTIPEEKLWTSSDPIPANDVPKYWNPERMHVVVFVYTDGGVEQVTITEVKNSVDA